MINTIKLFTKKFIHEFFVVPVLKRSDNGLLDLLLLNNNRPVVIASTGRAGSTLLFHSVTDAIYSNRFSRKYAERPLFSEKDITNMKKGRIYKTHLPFDYFKNVDAKYIFIYDDYSNTLKSYLNCLKVFGKNWCEQHLVNLKSEYNTDYSGLNYDILNYEHQLKSWINPDNSNVVSIAFSELWNIDLNKELGYKIDLPIKRERKSDDIEFEETELTKRLNILYHKHCNTMR